MTDTVPAPAQSHTPITHIVLFKYKSSLTWTQLESHFEAFTALRSKCLHPRTGKPLVKSMKMGKNRSWEAFAKGMTHGFILEFETQEDLDYYILEDPVHVQFSKAAAPLIEDSVVIDIKDGTLFGPAAEHPSLARATPPPTIANEYKGSCHCRSITWTVQLEKAEHVLCYCRTCQLLGGGPYSCNQIIPKENLRLTIPTPPITNEQGILPGLSMYVYQGASGKNVRCYFCAKCTSHVYHHQEVMPDKVIVRTLLLDQGPEMPATGEIFAEGRLGWVAELRQNL